MESTVKSTETTDGTQGPSSTYLSWGATDHGHWFVQLRWIAVMVAAFLVVITVDVLELLPHTVRLPLFISVAVLAILNAVYNYLLRSGRRTFLLGPFQAYADLVLLVIMLHFSGGIENPLALLMVFHVIIAGIMLSKRQCYRVTAFATLLFAAMAAAEMSGTVDHYTLQVIPHYEGEHGETAHVAHDEVYSLGLVALIAGILFLTAGFVTALSERLREHERQLAKMADRAVTQSQLLEQSLETTGTALFVCDAQFEPVLSNRRWDDWFKQIEKASSLREKAAGPESPMRKTAEDRRVRVTELSISPDGVSGAPEGAPAAEFDGSSRTYQLTTAPLVDSEGRCTHVVTLVQDTTDQKSAQARMLRAGKLAAVGELAGHVAHEVNNPIAIINAKSRLLLSDRRDDLSADTAAEIEKIIDLSSRVAEIAQGLLSYARPTIAETAAQNVVPSVRRALDTIRQRAENRGIVIEDRLPDEMPAASVNAKEIEQVFLNLFLNALDAMPGGGDLRVYSGSNGGDGWEFLEIVVEDSGAGVPPSVQERIFEPFFTTKPEGKGTGLGLAVCHGIVSRYGGSMRVETQVGKGTSITVRLPVCNSEPDSKYG